MQRFDTPAPVTAVVGIPAGRVRVIAADRADTTVEVLPSDASNGRDVKAAEQTTVDYDDGVLRVEASPVKNRILGNSGSGSVTLDETASVCLTAASGDVTIGRLGGPAEISTQRGDIDIAEAVSGTLVLRTEMGDVSVGAAHGVSASLDAGTTHGRIHNAPANADGAAAGLTVHATTGYGDITARSV